MDAKFQKRFDRLKKKLVEINNQISALFLQEPSKEVYEQAVKLYNDFVESRKKFLQDVAEEWRQTGVRQIDTVEVILLGEPDITWIPVEFFGVDEDESRIRVV